MMVDDKQETPLSNYNGLNRGNKVTESDHNKLELLLKIETPQIKPQGKDFFYFKSVLGQKIFLELINNENASNQKMGF